MSIGQIVRLAALPALLAACAGGPVPPDWQANAHAALREFTAAYLEGNTRVAEVEFARATGELSRTGRADLLARAELTRCAVRVASLEFDDCPGFQKLARDAGAAEQHYAIFIAGQRQGLDPAQLPAPYRALIATAGTPRPLGEIGDPLSRLIAAGALLRAGQLHPDGIAAAADTAAANGWRRPLLAWLGVQQKRAAEAGDRETVERLQRRLDLVAMPRAQRP